MNKGLFLTALHMSRHHLLLSRQGKCVEYSSFLYFGTNPRSATRFQSDQMKCFYYPLSGTEPFWNILLMLDVFPVSLQVCPQRLHITCCFARWIFGCRMARLPAEAPQPRFPELRPEQLQKPLRSKLPPHVGSLWLQSWLVLPLQSSSSLMLVTGWELLLLLPSVETLLQLRLLLSRHLLQRRQSWSLEEDVITTDWPAVTKADGCWSQHFRSGYETVPLCRWCGGKSHSENSCWPHNQALFPQRMTQKHIQFKGFTSKLSFETEQLIYVYDCNTLWSLCMLANLRDQSIILHYSWTASMELW